MGLSCETDFEPEPGDVGWLAPRRFSTHARKRAPKCCSCGGSVPAEKNCLQFERWKVPDCDVELRIYGEDCYRGPPRASWFMCWECGWRFLALAGHGYAIALGLDDMRELMIEHDDNTAAGGGGCQ